MTAWVFAAVAIVAGVPPVHVALVSMALSSPLLGLLASVGLGFRSFRSNASGSRDGRLLLEMAGSLRAGLTPRAALVAAGAEQVGERAVRLAAAGRPLQEAAEAIRPGSIELVAAIGLAGRVGGSVADALEALAAEELADAESRREVRSAAAPMVMQAMIVGGLPAGAVLYRLWTGSLISDLAAGDARSVLAATGVFTVAVGFAWIVALVRRALA